MICPQKPCNFGTSSTTPTLEAPQVCLHHSHYFPENPLNPLVFVTMGQSIWANMTRPREPRCYSEPAGSSYHVPAAPALCTTDLANSRSPCTTSSHCTCPFCTLPPTTLYTQASESTGLLTFLQLQGPSTQEVPVPPTVKVTVP